MMQPNFKMEKSDFRAYPGNNTVQSSQEYGEVEAHEVVMMAKKKFRSKEEGELFRDNTYCS